MKDIGIVKLYTAENNLQAEMILEALKERGIPAVKQDESAGGFMNLYGGSSFCGEKIYVAEENKKKAMEVLRGLGLAEEEEKKVD